MIKVKKTLYCYPNFVLFGLLCPFTEANHKGFLLPPKFCPLWT